MSFDVGALAFLDPTLPRERARSRFELLRPVAAVVHPVDCIANA